MITISLPPPAVSLTIAPSKRKPSAAAWFISFSIVEVLFVASSRYSIGSSVETGALIEPPNKLESRTKVAISIDSPPGLNWMFLARRGRRRSYDTTSRRVCAKLKRGARQVYGTKAAPRRLSLNRRRKIFVGRSRCGLICWGLKKSSPPSVHSPAFRRKRQTQIHFLTPIACGLKAGLHALFPQERFG